jgi:hypothetical protein
VFVVAGAALQAEAIQLSWEGARQVVHICRRAAPAIFGARWDDQTLGGAKGLSLAARRRLAARACDSYLS